MDDSVESTRQLSIITVLQVDAGMTFLVTSLSELAGAQAAAQSFTKVVATPDRLTQMLSPVFNTAVGLASVYTEAAQVSVAGLPDGTPSATTAPRASVAAASRSL